MSSKLYHFIINTVDKFVPHKFRPFWEHPAGPKYVFFWAPLIKWGLVLAAIGDLNRPVDKISTSQTGTLAATGFIWSRWAMVIIPKNWNLFSVNFFVGLSNSYQFARAYIAQQALKKQE